MKLQLSTNVSLQILNQKNLLKQMLLLLQHLQGLREDTSHWASSHLDPQILPIRLVSSPWNPLIMNTKTRDISPRSHQIEPSLQSILVTHTLNNAIRTSSVRELLDSRFQACKLQSSETASQN